MPVKLDNPLPEEWAHAAYLEWMETGEFVRVVTGYIKRALQAERRSIAAEHRAAFKGVFHDAEGVPFHDIGNAFADAVIHRNNAARGEE